MVNVLIKGLDEELYCRVKSEAARRRKRVGDLMNEALAVWVTATTRPDPERAANLRAYEQVRNQLRRHPGSYFVFARGRFFGRFRSLAAAAKSVRDFAGKPLVIRAPSLGEWLGGSLED